MGANSAGHQKDADRSGGIGGYTGIAAAAEAEDMGRALAGFGIECAGSRTAENQAQNLVKKISGESA